MLKVTYKLADFFSLKKYDDSNLNARSYEYPTLYGLRCAIVGSIIQLDGIEMAQDLFYKVKNATILVQYPEVFVRNGIRTRRFTNSSYENKREVDLTSADTTKNFTELGQISNLSQMGFREYVCMEKIVFYISAAIPDIEAYLKNIDWIGTSNSLVYLHSIEDTDKIDDVLLPWFPDDIETEDEKIYEQYDWAKKIEFENVYMFSEKRKHLNKRMNTYVGSLQL